MTKLKIEQQDFKKTQKTLGIHMAPSLQMETPFKLLVTKLKLYACRILTSNLNQYNLWKSYFVVFVLRMIYTLRISLHEKDTPDKFQKVPNQATLLKMKFKQNTAHAIVDGSSSYEGLGLRNLFIKQGIEQTIILTCQIRSNQPLENLTIIALS